MINNDYCNVEIEDDCTLAYRVSIYTTNHDISNPNHRSGKSVFKPVKIKKGCWIGANSIILSGVTIEEGCVIAAGSVVSKNCTKNGLYAGVPAKRIRDLEEENNL